MRAPLRWRIAHTVADMLLLLMVMIIIKQHMLPARARMVCNAMLFESWFAYDCISLRICKVNPHDSN